MKSFFPQLSIPNFSFNGVARKLPPKGILTLLDQGIFSLGNFFTSVLIGRYCAKEELGLYLLGFTIIYFLMDAQSAFITTPYTIFIPRKAEAEKSVYTGNTLFMQFGLAFVIALGIFIFPIILPASLLPEGMIPVLTSLAIVTVFLLLREYTRRLFFAQLKMKNALLLDVTIIVIQIILLVVLLYLQALSATTAILMIGITSGMVTIFWLYLDRNEIRFDRKLLRRDFNQCFQAGKWVFASGFLWNIGTYLYPWLLTSFKGTAATGTWAACLGIIALCNPVYLGLQNYLSPKIAHAYANNNKVDLRKFTIKSTAAFAGLLGICSVVLILFGGYFLVLLYGGKYAGNGIIISLLAVNLMLVAAGFSFSRAFFTLERADVDFKVNIVSLVVLFTFGLWIIYNYGILGAALGLVAGNAIALMLRFGFFRRLLS
ncbi:MAG: oligosaccharide flippase family protein [bacterium]|nr:MAG: oligosaccharide flippase family protein [bacterium]